jgi:pimeloyl-ACP methyl ester carboxylesterase
MRVRALVLGAATCCGLIPAVAGLGPAAPAAAAVAASGPACTRSLYGSTSPTAGQSAASRPVILVHGWTGSPLTSTAAALKGQLGSSISTFEFNYSKWSADWPTNTNIAPCLAAYVSQVSAAYKSAGGDGKVFLVAHSMGGLAIRYASDLRYAANPITAAKAPLIISLDTPYLGSPWGGTGFAEIPELWGGVVGKSVPDPFGTDGGKCLETHASGKQLPSGCGELPPWLPGGTTLYEIAGDITIDRTLFGVHLYDIDTGSDGVVPVGSSRGYLTSGPGGQAPVVSSPTTGTTVHSQYIDCTVSTGQVDNVLDAPDSVFSSIGVPLEELSDYEVLQDLQAGKVTSAVVAYSFAALGTASCSHIHITTDGPAIAMVARDIKSYLAAHPALEPRTGTVTLAPVNASGQPLAGETITGGGTAQCNPGSDSVGQAYRCFASGGIYDPCWLDTADPAQDSVLCQEEPWATRVVRLTVPGGGLPAFTGPPIPVDLNYPWGVELADGEQCIAVQGTHGEFDGKIIDYSCGGNGDHVLLRTLDRSSRMWTYQSAYVSGTGSQPGPLEAVKTAWYARPDNGAAAADTADDCTATALAYAAQAYEAAHNNPDGALPLINAQACDGGYSEFVFTQSAGPGYTASYALKATSSGWQVIGSADYIPPGAFGMPVSAGQAIVNALKSAPQTEKVAF